MRTVTQWLDEYGESHRNPVNKLLHWICVPVIVVAVIGLLWSLPVPAAFSALSPWLNWATLAALLSLVYYCSLSPALALGSLLVFVAMFAIVQGMLRLPWPLWQSSAAVFVVPGSGSSSATPARASARPSSRTCSSC